MLNEILKLVKLPAGKALLAVLMIISWLLYEQLTKKEERIEKTSQRTEAEVDSLRAQNGRLNNQLLAQNDSCNVRVEKKDAEMKALYRELLDEAKATKRQVIQSERNVDRALDQTRILNSR